MTAKEAARRRCNCKRAKNARPGRTRESIAREYDEWTRVAGIIIGISFGLILFIGILAG